MFTHQAAFLFCPSGKRETCPYGFGLGSHKGCPYGFRFPIATAYQFARRGNFCLGSYSLAIFTDGGGTLGKGDEASESLAGFLAVRLAEEDHQLALRVAAVSRRRKPRLKLCDLNWLSCSTARRMARW